MLLLDALPISVVCNPVLPLLIPELSRRTAMAVQSGRMMAHFTSSKNAIMRPTTIEVSLSCAPSRDRPLAGLIWFRTWTGFSLHVQRPPQRIVQSNLRSSMLPRTARSEALPAGWACENGFRYWDIQIGTSPTSTLSTWLAPRAKARLAL